MPPWKLASPKAMTEGWRKNTKERSSWNLTDFFLRCCGLWFPHARQLVSSIRMEGRIEKLSANIIDTLTRVLQESTLVMQFHMYSSK